MTPNQINQALADAGVRHIDVVLALKMNRTSRPIVSQVIHRNSRSARVEQQISKATGIPLKQLWPEWYDAQKKAARPRRVSAQS